MLYGIRSYVNYKMSFYKMNFLGLMNINNFCISFRHDTLRYEVRIALVGKYVKLEDSYASVKKSLEHASMLAERKLNLTVSLFFLLSEVILQRIPKNSEQINALCIQIYMLSHFLDFIPSH